METKDYLTNYYERYDENGRLISKHGMIEYITTMKYVKKYLQPGMRILEIGAATGRYSHALAQKGYCVDAVELVEHNIEIFKQNTTPGETVTITQGNAMDLSMFAADVPVPPCQSQGTVPAGIHGRFPFHCMIRLVHIGQKDFIPHPKAH